MMDKVAWKIIAYLAAHVLAYPYRNNEGFYHTCPERELATVKTRMIRPTAKTSRIPSFGLGGGKRSEKTVFQLSTETNKNKKKRPTLPGEKTPTSSSEVQLFQFLR